jgi:ribosomal-protein-alanine N-acetyltransferase
MPPGAYRFLRKETSSLAEVSLGMGIDWRPPTLQTPRLILRGLEESDADAIFAYASSPTVTQYVLWEKHQSKDETLGYLRDHVLPRYLEKTPEPYGICLKETPETVIGTIGCHRVGGLNRTMEMGYVLSESYHRRGIMPEAAAALLDYVFANTDTERVQAHSMAENVPSQRVMQKIGMRHEGCLRSALFHRGRFWDMEMYSILRGEWTPKPPPG